MKAYSHALIIDILDVQDAQAELDKATEQIYYHQETYNSIMRSNVEKITAEREVFHKFFTKPQALLKDVKVLQNTVKGKSAQSPQATPRRTPRPRRPAPGNAGC